MVRAKQRSAGRLKIVRGYTLDLTNHNGIIGENIDGPKIISADTLKDEKVVSPKGDHLGEIKHIMLDVRAGTIAYAVLSFGGFLGMGSKFFAIPWHCLALDVVDKWFVLNIDDEKLKHSPGFDKENWPTVADSGWLAEVHAYYGPVAPSRRPFI